MTGLVGELEDEAVSPLLGSLTPRELCQLELALTFLADHLPGQGVGALWHVLSTYGVLPGREREVRTLRLLMGDFARAGLFLRTLEVYAQLPTQVRGFERAESVGRRVRPSTVFTAKTSPYLVGRHDVYRQVLKEPVPYSAATPYRPAPAGSLCVFQRQDGSNESVHFPEWIRHGEPAELAEPVTARSREPLRFTKADLAATARLIEQRLAGHPQFGDSDFAGRTKRLDMAVPDPESGRLRDDQTTFEINGVAHTVGLMNSGKSTLLDDLTVLAAERGLRGGYVLPSVGECFTKTGLLRSLGIDAVPKLGQGDRAKHVAAYWRSRLQDGQTT